MPDDEYMLTNSNDPYLFAIGHLYNRQRKTALPNWRAEMHPSTQAVKALSELGTRAVSPLIEAMDAFAVEMRYSTAVDLGYHPRHQSPFLTKTIDNEIHRRLKQRWPNLCHAPAMSLVLIGKDAVEPLIEATDSEDWLVRVEAIWAASSIGDPRAIPAIRRLSRWWNIVEFPEIREMARKGLQLLEKKKHEP